MKTFFYRFSFLLASLGLAGLDIYFFVNAFLDLGGSEDWFLAFCFLLSAIFHAFIIFIIAKSFRHGTYFLPEIMFNEEGHPSKVAFGAALGLALLGLFSLLYYALALTGLNPGAAIDDRVVLELIVSTAALIFENSFFGLIYVALFKDEPWELR